MKVIILAGGYGTRLSEYTNTIPKPMVPIGDRPILWHIMKIYEYYGFSDFVLALGYKSQDIKEYFLKYHALNSDFTVDLASGEVEHHEIDIVRWKVMLKNTGLDTMTGGRIKRLKEVINGERFLLTYGDGVANVNIKGLIEFHESHGKLITVTAVRPTARFGYLDFEGDRVSRFEEKSQLNEGWINGGFFVCEPELLDYIHNDNQMLEREPLERIVEENQLMAFKHSGFWQSMDTLRDQKILENLWNTGKAPWRIW